MPYSRKSRTSTLPSQSKFFYCWYIPGLSVHPWEPYTPGSHTTAGHPPCCTSTQHCTRSVDAHQAAQLQAPLALQAMPPSSQNWRGKQKLGNGWGNQRLAAAAAGGSSAWTRSPRLKVYPSGARCNPQAASWKALAYGNTATCSLIRVYEKKC